MTRTHTTKYITLLSIVLALALTAALAACGSEEPSGVTGPDRTAPTTTDAPEPANATARPAASGSDEPPGVTGPDRTASAPTEAPSSLDRAASTPASGDVPTATLAPVPADATATVPPTATDTPVPADATATVPPAASRSDESDREVLVALYNATDGENWSNSDNWLSNAPLGEWYGVITNDYGRVIQLVLNDNGLSGEIPPELGSLSNLRWLFLGDDALSGEIPAELGSLNLRFLSLYRTALSGCMPSSLEDRLDFHTGLTVLDLPFC